MLFSLYFPYLFNHMSLKKRRKKVKSKNKKLNKDHQEKNKMQKIILTKNNLIIPKFPKFL